MKRRVPAWAIIATALLMCFVRVAFGQSPEHASYRITVEDGIAGSATGISPKLAVTNAHVVRSLHARVTLTNHLTGKSVSGRCFARDPNADLALILCNQDIGWVAVDVDGIKPSQPAYKYGYGGTGTLEKIASRLIDRNSLFADGRWARLTTPSISGDSGGGVFQDGKLVAVVWGSSDTTGRDPNGDSRAAEAVYIDRLAERYDQRYGTQVRRVIFGCDPQYGCPPGFGRSPNLGRSPLPHRNPVTPDDLKKLVPVTPDPSPSPAPTQPAPPAIDSDFIEKLVKQIVGELPKPKDGMNGRHGLNGKDGKGVSRVYPSGAGNLTVEFTDGTTHTIEGLGITIDLYDPDRRRVDSEFVPLGGTLRLQQYLESPKGK